MWGEGVLGINDTYLSKQAKRIIVIMTKSGQEGRKG